MGGIFLEVSHSRQGVLLTKGTGGHHWMRGLPVPAAAGDPYNASGGAARAAGAAWIETGTRRIK